LILNLYYNELLTPQEISFVLEDCELRVMQFHRDVSRSSMCCSYNSCVSAVFITNDIDLVRSA
jgi:hypothetical protein